MKIVNMADSTFYVEAFLALHPNCSLSSPLALSVSPSLLPLSSLSLPSPSLYSLCLTPILCLPFFLLSLCRCICQWTWFHSYAMMMSTKWCDLFKAGIREVFSHETYCISVILFLLSPSVLPLQMYLVLDYNCDIKIFVTNE